MAELVEFLRARLNEEEQAATAEREYWAGMPSLAMTTSVAVSPLTAIGWDDPVRVLAEVTAKRRIVDHHQPITARKHAGFDCAWCAMHWPCFDIRAAAAPHATHPDYRQEWTP